MEEFNQKNPSDSSSPADLQKWQEIWQASHRILEEKIVPTQFKAWIQPLQLVKTAQEGSHQVFYLGVYNDFSAQWLRDHHQRTIDDALTQVLGKPSRSKFSVSEKFKKENNVPSRDLPHDLGSQLEAESKNPPQSQPTQGVVLGYGEHRSKSGALTNPMASAQEFDKEQSRNVQNHAVLPLTFDPRFDFETFVVGSSNQFAHASAIAVAERPGEQYNPLFIYSQPGLGKTHLLYAIGNQCLRKNRNARVAYLSAENFVNELIESLKHQKMPQFRRKYRDSFDILLIDDIQFIAGKKQTEEEFFHTFNALYGSKRQIVVTSDRPPKEIEKLEERIRTRFEWGLVADIQPPEIETRIAILKQKAERDDIYLPDDVATYLASHIKSNVRELEGTLIRLQAQASLSGAEISLEMAKQELKHIVEETSSQITVEAIQSTVAKHFRLKIHDLKSTTRTKAVALPRQIAMYLIRKYTGFGWKVIGDHFGKDHTTVMHAFEKIDQGYENNSEIHEAVEAIQNQL